MESHGNIKIYSHWREQSGEVFVIRIQWMPEKEAIVYVPRTFAEEHDLDVSSITVHFGAWNREVKLAIDPALPPDQIGLADGILRHLTIPSHLPYNVRIDENGLHIGPVIGIIASQTRERITPEKLDRHIRRLSNYESIRGLIFLCTVNEIDQESRTIRGDYYDPNGPHKPRWVKGRFPYPGAFYKRIRIEQHVYEHLTKVIGPDRVFNRYYFYKLQFWNIMSRTPETREHLPYTEELVDIRQLDRFIEEYGSVFLKPSQGSQGNGIVQVQKPGNRYRFSFRGRKTPSLLTTRQTIDLLNWLKGRKTYLIQQAVQMKHGKSPIDFRVYMQKDSRLQWMCKGMIARIAKAESIVTNLSYLDRLMYPDEAFQEVFQLKHEEAKSLKKHIHKVCCTICNTLDRLSVGLYGDVAIDLTVDINRKVWILEINKKYSWKSLHRLGATHLLNEILTGPLEYAKALAGFPGGGDLITDRSTSATVPRTQDQILAPESDIPAEVPSFANNEKDGPYVKPSAKPENPPVSADSKKQSAGVDLQKGDPPDKKRRESRHQPDQPRSVAVSGGPLSHQPRRSKESRTANPLRKAQRPVPMIRAMGVRSAGRVQTRDRQNRQRKRPRQR